MTAMPTPYLSLGLCSVTLRALSVEEVVAVTAGAGLECIEWGGDVHVAPGDLAAARRAREATLAAGLRVASYGSYWRCAGDFAPVLATARELGAPRVRIWAGETGSADATPAERDAVAAAARAAAASAASPPTPIALAFELHGGTLTDTFDSALALVEASGVPCYWQPPQSLPDAEALDGLRRLPDVPAVHVFSWWPGSTRLRLSERADLWRAVFEVFRSGDALLEFVPGDDPALVAEEAEACRALAS
jgi:3-dehydroshikimate dehydratase